MAFLDLQLATAASRGEPWATLNSSGVPFPDPLDLPALAQRCCTCLYLAVRSNGIHRLASSVVHRGVSVLDDQVDGLPVWDATSANQQQHQTVCDTVCDAGWQRKQWQLQAATLRRTSRPPCRLLGRTGWRCRHRASPAGSAAAAVRIRAPTRRSPPMSPHQPPLPAAAARTHAAVGRPRGSREEGCSSVRRCRASAPAPRRKHRYWRLDSRSLWARRQGRWRGMVAP